MDTYANYISQFKVYPTMKEAKAKGYEAHHIVPRALQTELDDRCVRLTPFEHIYAHYLLALESKEGARIFYGMYNISNKKLTSLEQITIESLEDWARLREEGKKLQGKRISESNTGKPSSFKGQHQTDAAKRKMSEAKKGKTPWNKGRKGLQVAWNKGISIPEEARNKISESLKETYSHEEHRNRLSESHKGQTAWNKGKNNCFSDDSKRKMSESHKGQTAWNKGIPCPDEQKRRQSECMKGKPSSTKGRKWFNNGTKNVMAYECPEGFVPGQLTKVS